LGFPADTRVPIGLLIARLREGISSQTGSTFRHTGANVRTSHYSHSGFRVTVEMD